jgi:hypothetical protein
MTPRLRSICTLTIGMGLCFSLMPLVTDIALACEGPTVLAIPNELKFNVEEELVEYENMGPGNWKPTGTYKFKLVTGAMGEEPFLETGTTCTGEITPGARCDTKFVFSPPLEESYDAIVEALPGAELVTLKG